MSLIAVAIGIAGGICVAIGSAPSMLVGGILITIAFIMGWTLSNQSKECKLAQEVDYYLDRKEQ